MMKTLVRRIYKAIKFQNLSLLKSSGVQGLTFLGSDYGRKAVLLDQIGDGAIISAGVGEDISFDIELMNVCRKPIVLCDPTPRAIGHVNQVLATLGKAKRSEYSSTGSQNVTAYELTNISASDINFYAKALWTVPTVLRFFAPKDPAHVSHSISNWQNDYKVDTSYIDVETVTLKDLMEVNDIDCIDLLKVDIEGAEIEVLNKMLDDDIHPRQICVEFDELNSANKERITNCFKLIKRMRAVGYKLIYFDGLCDFTFIMDPQ